MAEIFHPKDNLLDIAGVLPAEYRPSAALAERVLEAVRDRYLIDRMSWRPAMKNAVVYLRLNDPRLVFADQVGGLAVLPPSGGRGQIRLGFTREPAADDLMTEWKGSAPIVRQLAWKHPVLDVSDMDAHEAEGALREFDHRLVTLADDGALKRGGTSGPELRMRRALQRHFPEAQFERARPTWLIGAKGKPLELDLYSPVLNIGVEVQGPYHFHPIQGDELLALQQARDAMKRTLCAERGVRLLVVEAGALDRQVLRLRGEAQAAALRNLLARAEATGFYEWSGDAGEAADADRPS